MSAARMVCLFVPQESVHASVGIGFDGTRVGRCSPPPAGCSRSERWTWSIEGKRHPATLRRMAAIRGLVEVVLVVEDIDRSMKFYRDALGLELISPPALPVKFLRIGGARDGVPQQVVLIPRAMAAEQPLAHTKGLHHIGLEVAPEDYERERERLAGLGFELRGGKHPFMPVDAFYFDDPDDNEIELATWRGGSESR
jgi:catechol 2,3-dioxygenase-like lactoylglutathione lyase family enzyme